MVPSYWKPLAYCATRIGCVAVMTEAALRVCSWNSPRSRFATGTPSTETAVESLEASMRNVSPVLGLSGTVRKDVPQVSLPGICSST